MNNKVDDIINFLADENGFFCQLEEYSIFEKSKFHQFALNVAHTGKQKLHLELKYKLANSIWETVFKIQLLLGAHLDPNDIYVIDNINDEDVYQIQKICYYIANWFARGSPMETRLLSIGGW